MRQQYMESLMTDEEARLECLRLAAGLGLPLEKIAEVAATFITFVNTAPSLDKPMVKARPKRKTSRR